MTEPPFVPRDYVFRKQQYYQNIRKHTYLKGPYDKITSVVIPITLAVTALSMIGRGIYNMSHGIGKKEWAMPCHGCCKAQLCSYAYILSRNHGCRIWVIYLCFLFFKVFDNDFQKLGLTRMKNKFILLVYLYNLLLMWTYWPKQKLGRLGSWILFLLKPIKRIFFCFLKLWKNGRVILFL